MENGKKLQNEICLEVKNLTTSFFMKSGKKVHAVKNTSLTIGQGEMLGVVGESGSGKSVMVKSILRLITEPGRIENGEVLFEGRDLLKLTQKEMQAIRGDKMSMIFQEPMTALNPSFSIAWQIGEVYKLHENYTKEEIYAKTLEALKLVKIPDPERIMKQYPHQLSGGMRQRVLIAMALACKPKILFADEPTTALDVTVQADILDLLDSLRESENLSIVLISHNLNMVTERCDRVVVIYAGEIQEIASSEDIVSNPMHPYTVGLMNSLPDITKEGQVLTAIPGELPDLTELPAGCSFYPRCAHATPYCQEQKPELTEFSPGRFCRCHRVVKGG